MKNLSLVSCLLVVLLGMLSAGCDSGIFGGNVCTQMGCSDGVTITISEERPDSLTVEIFLEDDTEAFASTLCTNTVQTCILGAEEVTPQTITVELRWNNEEIRKTFTPDYVNFRPNG